MFFNKTTYPANQFILVNITYVGMLVFKIEEKSIYFVLSLHTNLSVSGKYV